MRLLILSDIHANIAALRAIERDAGSVDAVYCAGDYVDYGTDPHEAIAWVRERNARCVIGNHDTHLLSVFASGETERLRGTSGYKWVHDNCDRVSEEDIAFLRALPRHLSFQADGIAYVMQHQVRDNSYEMPECLQAFDSLWNAWYTGKQPGAGRRMIFGHTHRRCVHGLADDVLWLNPGSASYRRPDDRDKRAHYMIIEDGEISFHAVAYERGAMLARAMEYVRTGTMLTTDLQDAMFFFGDAKTSREPLPEI